MVLGLLTTSLLSIVCFVITVFLGWQGRANVSQHVLYGIFATFLVTLAQSMTMFYFIGTGKQVKDLVATKPAAMGNDFIRRTKIFKARVFPPALWAMLFTMATFIIGGGVHTNMIPAWIHGVLAAAALYYNLVAFWRDAKYMLEHNVLMSELERQLNMPQTDV